jgi:hypothetical protein
MASQRAAFLFGGVPELVNGNSWPKPYGRGFWDENTVRKCTSLALQFRPLKKVREKGTFYGMQPAYTIRVKASGKREIRRVLEHLYTYKYQTIYPDFQGFSSHGTKWLPAKSPDTK